MLPAGVAIGDEAEAQTVPYILGIAHPTGFPAYTLAGWAFAHFVPFGTVAWRLNAFDALTTAASAVAVYALALTLESTLAAAIAAAAIFAFASSVWNGALHANAQSSAATLSICALVASVAFAKGGRRALLFIACGCCGLALAVHANAIWIIPAILVATAFQRPTLDLRSCTAASAFFVAPLLLYAYLPLRALYIAAHGLDPAAGFALPAPGHIDWNFNQPQTATGLLNELLGRNEGASVSLGRAFVPAALGPAAASWFALVVDRYHIVASILVVAGALVLARLDRRALAVIAAGTLGGIAFLYSYRLDEHVDRYELVSLAVAAALAAAASRIRIPHVAARTTGTTIAAALALTAAWNIATNRPQPNTDPLADGETIIAQVARETPDNAIIVAEWNPAAALAYGAYVEHELGGRIIVSGWPWDYDADYPAWLHAHPVVLLLSPGLRGPQLQHVTLLRVPQSPTAYSAVPIIPLPPKR